MNKFMLLVTCIISILCSNNYAANATTHPIHAVPAIVVDHPGFKKAFAHFKATKKRELTAFGILVSFWAICLQHPSDANMNTLASAVAEHDLRVTKTKEAMQQLNEACRAVNYHCLMSAHT